MKFRLMVLLDNIRSAHNVGSIFRTCESAGVDQLILVGITAHPPHPKLEKTALGSDQSLSWEYHEGADEVIKRLKKDGFEIVSLEVTADSEMIFESTLNRDVCLVLGNEVEGVSDEVLAVSDRVVRIPHFGNKESLNVSIAAGVAIYEYRRKILISAKG